jgi:chromate transporter
LPAPSLASVNWVAVAIGVIAAVLVFRLSLGTLKVLGLCAALGCLAAVIGLS